MTDDVEPRFPSALGAFDSRRTPVLQADVLVIGAGIAGASAALRAAEDGASVLCLSKTPLDDVNTAWAQGGVAAVLRQNDSFGLHLDDTLRVGAGLTSLDSARAIIERGPECVQRLIDLGARFDVEPDGQLALGREGGHSVNRVVHAGGDATGAEIERTLAQALHAHERVICRFDAFVRDLFVVDGRCVGAVIESEGTELAVQTGAVVMAAGGSGQVYRETTNPAGASGDGVALCFRAGAGLADMEFIQFHPTVLYIAGASRFLISEVVRGAGALLRDASGERFMPGLHPMAELAPRDVVSRAILERMVATNDTHVYLDLSAVRGNPHELFPSISRICRAFDIDIAVDPIPVRPGAHYMIGGVETDLFGRTSVAGLYAVGEVATVHLHGANRLASNSLLEGAALGWQTGRTAAAESHIVPLPRSTSDPWRAEFSARLQLDDMLYSLKSLMWRQVGLRRDRADLAEAVHRIGLWNHYLSRAHQRDRRAFALENMLTTSALMATAALVREESRGTHFRTDFPERDDEEWSRYVRLQRGADGRIELTKGDVFPPTDRAGVEAES